MIIKQKVWVLMSEDRKVIAKGVPRDRHKCLIDEGNKRILTYSSEGKAKRASTGFFTSPGVLDLMKNTNQTNPRLEPVQVTMELRLEE